MNNSFNKFKNHSKHCNICKSEVKKEIESKYINWYPIEKLQTDFGLTRDEIEEHSIVFGLCDLKYRNVKVGIVRAVENFDISSLKSKDIIDLIKVMNTKPAGSKSVGRKSKKKEKEDKLMGILNELDDPNEEIDGDNNGDS